LVEGNSAGGTAKEGRNRRFQAILPLRGKILNVEKAQEHKIYDNEQIKNMLMAIGVSIGTQEDDRAVNTEKLRYHKIVIMTDADVDGSHIRTLILTFFFRYLQDLIKSGYLYIALPPLYLIKKGSESHYCWSEDEREQHSEELSRNGKAKTYQKLSYHINNLLQPNTCQYIWSTLIHHFLGFSKLHTKYSVISLYVKRTMWISEK